MQILLKVMSEYDASGESSTDYMQNPALLTAFRTELTTAARTGRADDTINTYEQPEVDAFIALTANINQLLFATSTVEVRLHLVWSSFTSSTMEI